MKIKPKKRNYLVPLLHKKTGGGKHKNRKKELKQNGYSEDLRESV